MSNYTKTTDFTAKDSLPSGNAAKKVVGSEFDTEFNNISTAIATKADTTALTAVETIANAALPKAGGTLTGNVGLNTAVNPTVTIRNTDTSIAASQVVGTIEFRGDDDSAMS